MNATAASATTSAVALSPDNVLFSKYEIGRLLGCGAFAKVYYAREISTGRSVAVKVINKSRLRNKPNLMNNTIREISIMSRLRHPHIVKIFEVMATKSKIYLVMEYLKGGELFSRVAKGRLSEDLTRKYFQQLISAVNFCHQRGVYHRDLKLENMLLDDHGNLKVTDFGLSALNEQKCVDDGLLHTLCGTPAYVAPEILAKKGYDGAKADVWSCGVVLFVLIAGYLPFNDQNLMNMYRKIYRGEYRCPKWTSPDLRRIISSLLDPNPVTRITIDEIKQDQWFKRGYKEIRPDDPAADLRNVGKKSQNLNAFDIISLSRGLDLSGMFSDAPHTIAVEVVDRVAAEDSPEGIMEKVAAAVMAENGGVRLRRKKGSLALLEGQNGTFTVLVEVYRLTDRLVVVEVKRRGAGDANAFSELWDDKIKPLIQVPGNH